jgi:hypothetical protein
MGRVHPPYRPPVFEFNQILLKLMAVTIKASAVANPGFAKLPETDYTSVVERSGTLKVKGVEQSVTFLDFKNKEGKTFASMPDISLPYVLLEDEGKKSLGLLLAGETVVFPDTGTLSSKSTGREIPVNGKKIEVYDVILSSCKLSQFKVVTKN